jgi:hypothetical protein
MFRLFALLLVGLVLAGCQTTTEKSKFTTSNFKTDAAALKNVAAFPEGRTKQKAWLKYHGYKDNWEVQSTVQTILANSDSDVCKISVTSPFYKLATAEAKRRGLSCGVGEASTTQIASINNPDKPSTLPIEHLCAVSSISSYYEKYTVEIKRRGLTCHKRASANDPIGHSQYDSQTTMEADQHSAKNKVKTTTPSNTPSSAELTASQKEAERLRQELAALKAQQEQKQQSISSDKQKPVINIAGTAMNGPQGTIKGYVRDNTGVAEVRVDGKLVAVDSYGNFMANTYVPQSGINVSIEAVDLAGLTSSMSVRLDRLASSTATTIAFDRLNPLGRDVASNEDALALIIGVNEYAKTPAKAHYADSDAQVFSDYAIQKLGIPANRVKTLVNNNADESGMLLAVKDWLARANRQGKSDIYIFFAGHGLASDDGEKMYLLPYDGSPRLLSDTAIARERLFADISAANPRSVTVFLDTCYSGTTRGTDMLIASRPIAIRALEQSIPDNFTVMTAAAGDQTAKPLEEAKHGMFSYFLMKGMEGEADANNDNEITAGELHSYVQTNVIQQSSGSQTPELQGDADRVLVRFK